MKGRNHLLSGVVFLLFVFLIDLFFGLYFYSFFASFPFIVVFVVFYLFFAGILLPDSDKLGSWIFKFFFPLALVSWLLGLIASSLRGKWFRHRGFLHSVQGVFLTSLFSSILIFIFLSVFIELNVVVLLIFFCSVLLGQLLHLLFD